jgi:hypothetical protein
MEENKIAFRLSEIKVYMKMIMQEVKGRVEKQGKEDA